MKTIKLNEISQQRLAELDNTIYDLYKKRGEEIYDALAELSDSELVALMTLCFITNENPYGSAYDDEVFDELDTRSNRQMLLFAADVLWRTHYDYAMTNDILRYLDRFNY